MHTCACELLAHLRTVCPSEPCLHTSAYALALIFAHPTQSLPAALILFSSWGWWRSLGHPSVQSLDSLPSRSSPLPAPSPLLGLAAAPPRTPDALPSSQPLPPPQVGTERLALPALGYSRSCLRASFGPVKCLMNELPAVAERCGESGLSSEGPIKLQVTAGRAQSRHARRGLCRLRSAPQWHH